MKLTITTTIVLSCIGMAEGFQHHNSDTVTENSTKANKGQSHNIEQIQKNTKSTESSINNGSDILINALSQRIREHEKEISRLKDAIASRDRSLIESLKKNNQLIQEMCDIKYEHEETKRNLQKLTTLYFKHIEKIERLRNDTNITEPVKKALTEKAIKDWIKKLNDK